MILSSLRQALSQQVPAWLNTPVDRHLWKNLTTSPDPTPPPADRLPHWRRRHKVYQVLDRIQSQVQPLPSYSQLCQQVKAETGTACSRKLISRWKLERGLRS